MIRIAICDDDEKTLLSNERRTKNYLRNKKKIAEIESYQSSQFLLYEIQENKYYDLLLLDIEMPDKDGMEVARNVKKISPNTLIIFITSHSEYAIDSFELSIFRFIPKDKIDQKLPQAIADAVTFIELQKDKTYLIATPTRYEKIPYKSIISIQKDGKYSLFTTDRGETQIRLSLNKVYEQLKSKEFIYIDRGCVVNLLHIMRLDNQDVVMKNGVILPSSRRHMRDLKITINNYWGKQV